MDGYETHMLMQSSFGREQTMQYIV